MNTLLTEEEVAKRLHVSLASIRRWRLERRGPQFIKVDSLVRYRPEDLESWLASLPTGGAQLVKAESGSANGHVSRQMLRHYSHTRMQAKREALQAVGKKQQEAEDKKKEEDAKRAQECSAVSASAQEIEGPTVGCFWGSQASEAGGEVFEKNWLLRLTASYLHAEEDLPSRAPVYAGPDGSLWRRTQGGNDVGPGR